MLLIARFFPPSGVIGARRAERLVRLLGELGARTSVVTVEPYYDRIRDTRSLDPMPLATVLRTRTLSPLAHLNAARGATPAAAPAPPERPAASPPAWRPRLAAVVSWAMDALFVPDPDVVWVPTAVRTALACHARTPVDLVVATAPPWSSLLAAVRVGRRTGAPVVLDYRDPWRSIRREKRPRARLREALEERLEARILDGSDLALFTSDTALSLYRLEVPETPRAEVLPNAVDAWVAGSPPPSRPPLLWAHAGLLYGGRSLATVIRGLAAAPEVDARLLLIGDRDASDAALAGELGVESRVEWLGRLPLQDCLDRLRGCHRLLTVVGPAHPHSIPGKVFDYLSTRRPQLVLAPPGHAAARLVERAGAGIAIAPGDVAAATGLLRTDAAALACDGIPDLPEGCTAPFAASRQRDLLGAWLAALLASGPRSSRPG